MLRPLGDRLVIQRTVETDEVRRGSIIIPEKSRERPQEGIVVAVGPSVQSTVVDNRVLFGKYSGVDVEVDGSTYLIIRETEILGVLS